MTREHDNQSFDQALEAVLEGRKIPSESLGEEDRAILALASDLAKTDFSAVYGDRAALRRRLLDRHGESREAWSSTGGKVGMSTYKRRLAMAAAAVVVVGILAFARFSPALAGSRQEVAGWLQAAGLPEEVVISITGASFGAVVRNEDGSIQILTFHDVSSVEEAQAAATFTVKQPTVLPDGLALKSVSVTEEGNWVVLAYANSAGDMMFSLSQSTVAPPSGEVSMEAGLSVHLEGPSAVNAIHWEADGVYYELSGTFSQAQLQAIADSVQ